jgi:ABC-type lipoprotein release transport system permease subunit
MFSFFTILAAVILVALLFRLGIDQRSGEIGTLLALGFRPRRVAGILALEGLAVAAVAGLLGVLGGVGYAALMLVGLRTWWVDVVVVPFLRLHVTPLSLTVGYVSGVMVSVGAMAWAVRQASRVSVARLLAARAGVEPGLTARPSRWLSITAAMLLVAAVAVGAVAGRMSEDARAGAFFGAGALVLAASLVFVWTRFRSGATGPAVARGRGNLLRLAVRNAARNPGRSSLCTGLVASACFLIIAVSAFHIDPIGRAPELASGDGGFALVGETVQPVYHDLNTAAGRASLGVSPDDEAVLASSRVVALRVRAGDDASCLNLYKPHEPRILGVPPTMIRRGGFDWAAADADSADEHLNPWLLLDQELGSGRDGIPRAPVVIEKNTALYALHLWNGIGETLDVTDGRGRKLRLMVVGLLNNGIFQGDLLVTEKVLLQYFPETSGYRFFLVEAQPRHAQAVGAALERTLGSYGFTMETTGQRLARFLAVQNTYLSTFQSLGGLGLLLGTFGLAAVELRNVLERRGELAVLRATGFRRRTLAGLVMLENSLLLVGGLGIGALAAVVSLLPHLFSGSAAIPWTSLGGTVLLILVVGLIAGLSAVRAVLVAPMLPALRGE